MPEKDTIFKGKLKQSGLFNFKDFYSFVYDYMSEEGYSVAENSYSEKVSGDTKGIDINWTGTKKISDYFKFEVKLAWQIVGMKEVEVEREGKKLKMNSGSIEIRFNGTIIKDQEGKWEERPLSKFLRGVYDRFVIKTRVEQYEDKLVGEVNDIVAQCKAFLAIEGKK